MLIGAVQRVVKQLEVRLQEKGEQCMDRFLGVVLEQLVDSNVFLRSLVLSVQKGDRQELTPLEKTSRLPSCCVRPAGSSGACLVVAARLNIPVVHIFILTCVIWLFLG